jgi:hypothetical protein
VKKPKAKRIAKHEEYDLNAAAEAFAESFDKMIKDRLASLPHDERRAWLNRLWRRVLGPAGLSLGLYRDDDQSSPAKKPRKASAKPPRRRKVT